MARSGKTRDKAAEKAVKSRLQQTHLKSVRILGSEATDEITEVFLLRMVGTVNYLFKVHCVKASNGGYDMSGLVPVVNAEDFGEYRVYNPQPASADALRPTEKEKKFTGYGK
ncbi:MAG: hypothetical protein ACI4KL_02660 [Lentihominibacter sp.]